MSMLGAAPIRVLIVDDDDVDRMAVRRILGAEERLLLEEASDADAALERLHGEAFDCVISDYRMAPHDALWLLRRMRSGGLDIPVIVLTGQGDEQTAVELMKAGAADYFGKAKLTTESLWQSVRHAVRVHRVEREAKRANLALRESEERLRMALDAAALGCWDFNPHTFQIEWDTRAKALFGFPGDVSADYDAFLDEVHANDRVLVEDAIHRALDPSTGGVYEIEYRTAGSHDGVERWLRATGRATFVEQRAERLTGTIQDITERKRQEAERSFLTDASAALSSSLDYAQALSRLADAAVPLVADWCFVDILEEEGGYRRVYVARSADASDDLVETARRSALSDSPELLPAQTLSNARPVHVTEFRPEHHGELAPTPEHLRLLSAIGAHSLLVVPVISMGEHLGVITMLFGSRSRRKYNTADVRLAEELARRCSLALENALLHRRTEKLLSEVRARADFEQQLIGIVSHDLRNPLNAIMLACAMLKRRNSDLDPRTAKSLSTIESSAERATRLVCDLLDFTQARLGGGIRIDRRPLDLAEVVRQAVDEAALAFRGRQIDLRCEGDATGTWDGDRMAQVVANLVSNAFQYSLENSVVQVVLTGEPTQLRLEVHNVGEPIPAEKLRSLFEPLQRASGSPGRGIGLGLYIVEQLVRAHQGSIEVRSDADHGTTFSVTVPRCSVEHEDRAKVPAGQTMR